MRTRLSPLVGRDAVLREIRSALEAVARGTGGRVMLEGPAGIGKSRLMAATLAEADGLGLAVAAGRATEFDRVAPLTTLLAVLRSSRPPVVDAKGIAALADLGGVESSRFWLVDRLGALIEDYVRTRPLIIALDDAQWTDELTSLALRILVPALRLSPVLWIVACRPTPVTPSTQNLLHSLFQNEGLRLRIEPLPAAAVAEMCGAVLGGVPDRTILDLAERSSGNPFLLEELLTALRDDGRVVITAGSAGITDGELPVSFLTAVNLRLRDLSDEARWLLEIGSVLGRPFTMHEAAGLAGRPAMELVSSVKEAVDAGTLVPSGSELTFRHDLIREAVYEGMAAPVRQALHREAVSMLLAEGRSAVEAACHLIRSSRKGDDQALVLMQQAIVEVVHKAPGTAADLTLRMLDMMSERDPSRPRLVADAVRLLASAGRLKEARELGEDALRDDLPAPLEAAILLGLAEALKHAGQEQAVLSYTRRALARPDVPEPARAQLLAVQAHGLLQADDFDAAARAGREAVDVGLASGEHSAVVFGQAARVVGAQAAGALSEAIALANEAVQIAETAGGEARRRHPRLWLAPVLVAADRFVEADAVYEVGQREAQELGTAWSQPLWHYYRAELRLSGGRLDDAAAEAEAGVDVAEQLSAMALAAPLLATLTQVAVRRDELSPAREYLRRAQRLVDSGIGVMSQDLTWTLALVQEASGQPDAAMESLVQIYEALPQRLFLLTEDPSAGPFLVRLALRTGEEARAKVAADAIGMLGSANPAVASLRGAAAHAEGLLGGDLNALRAAVSAYRASPRPLARASAMEDAGQAEDAAGNRDDAVALLEEALGVYLDSGATRDVARTRRRLRKLGVRRRPARHAPVRAGNGWASLTHSELRVARLVAEGLTNREVARRLFLSRHTVDTHLRHAFGKLGVSSRVELTRQVLTADRKNS